MVLHIVINPTQPLEKNCRIQRNCFNCFSSTTGVPSRFVSDGASERFVAEFHQFSQERTCYFVTQRKPNEGKYILSLNYS